MKTSAINLGSLYKRISVLLFILAMTSSCTDNEEFSTIESSTDLKIIQVEHASEFTNLDFNKSFVLTDSVILEGTEKAPLFTSGIIAFSDEKIVVPDPMNNYVLMYHRNGEFDQVLGRPGTGPGEFSDPNWAEIDDQGQIYIREGNGNFRVQRFSKDGTLIDQFPLYSFGPFTQSYLTEEEGELFLYTATRSYCGEESASELCVVQKQEINGDVIKKMGPELEIQPDRKGLPFVAGFYNNDKVYLAHRNGSNVAAYSLKSGALEYTFNLSASPDVKTLDMKSLPDHPTKRREVTRGKKFTILRRINFYKDFIVLDHLRMNNTNDQPKYFLDFFDHKGNLVYAGIEVDHRLESIIGDTFIFSKEDEHSEFGRFYLYEYTFNPSH